MDLFGRRKTYLKQVIALLGIYFAIVTTASQADFQGNNLFEDEPIKISINKKRINVADATKDPSLAEDFPEIDILSHILPLISFECQGRLPGYYADHKFHCEIFHFCKQDGTRSTYTCPYRSRFNQGNGACEDEQAVQCDQEMGEGKKFSPSNSSSVAPKDSNSHGKRIARQALFQPTPLNRQILASNNVLFVPQTSNGFVQFLVPQQQQQQLFHLNVPANSQFAPVPAAQTQQAAQIQAPPNFIPSSGPIFVSSPSTHRAPIILNADNAQQSSSRQGQFVQQPSGTPFTNQQRRLPSSGLSLIRHDPVLVPHPSSQINTQRQLTSSGGRFEERRPPNPAFARQQQPQLQQQPQPQPQRPSQSTGSTFVPQQRPQNQGANFGNQQQRPPTNSFLSQPRQVPQGPLQGFDRRPISPFEQDFFDESSPFFERGPPRFLNQNSRPQLAENSDRPPFMDSPRPVGPFFGTSPFQNPALDDGFFDSDFPQFHIPENQRPPQRPPQPQQQRPQNEPRPPQAHVGTNFNLSPEDNAFINEIRFPGPPRVHNVNTIQTPTTSSRPTQNEQRPPPSAPQRPAPQRPPPQGFSQPDSGERGFAQFPSRFPPEPQNNFGFPPQRDQRPPQFSSGPFFTPPEAPQRPARPTQAPQSPPPRRPSPAIDSQPQAPARRPAISDQNQQQFETTRPRVPLRTHDDRRFSAGPPRPLATSTPSSLPAHPPASAHVTRGRDRFRPQQGDEFEFGDQGDDVPQRGPENDEPVSHRPVSAESFGIPPPTEDFGSKLESEGLSPNFQAPPPSTHRPSPQRRPVSQQRRPPPSPQFFSANPARPVELSTPPSVPLRRPTTDQSITREPRPTRPSTSDQRFHPNDQPSSTENLPRGQQGFQTHNNNNRNNRPFEHVRPSTELPNDFFSSQEPLFPESVGGSSSELPNHSSQNFPQFFSSNENNFGNLGFNEDGFRAPFSHQSGIPSTSGSIPSTQPSFQEDFNPFLQQNSGNNRFVDSRPTFSDANIPSEPTFGPQSVDQLAPPELPPFTARPDTADSISATEETPRGHYQRGSHTTSQDGLASPTEIVPTTEVIDSSPKRGSQNVGVTTNGKQGIRTRPARVRSRTRRPGTTEPIPDLSNDLTTTAKPRRRVRPTGGTLRRRPNGPIVTRTLRTKTTTTTEAPISSHQIEDSTVAAVAKRRPAVKRVQARKSNASRAVVRRRRPTTTTASSDFFGTVDHSASNTKEHILSSDSTNRKVAIVSKLDAVHDSAISASHEQFIVTKADTHVSHQSSIRDHSFATASTESIGENHITGTTPAIETTTTTIREHHSTALAKELPTPSVATSTATSSTTTTTTEKPTTSTAKSPSDGKPEALTKLKLLLNRKFVLKLTTEAPSS